MPVACMTLTHAIEIEAHRLGFALVGVTSPVKPPHYDIYEAWLTRGRHAGMTYLAWADSRMRRADPLNILPDCRSIIVLGTPYPKTLAEPTLPALPYRGNVASYAWDEITISVFRLALMLWLHLSNLRQAKPFPTLVTPIAGRSWNAIWRNAPDWVGSVKTRI
jgi:hypothetical protein